MRLLFTLLALALGMTYPALAQQGWDDPWLQSEEASESEVIADVYSKEEINQAINNMVAKVKVEGRKIQPKYYDREEKKLIYLPAEYEAYFGHFKFIFKEEDSSAKLMVQHTPFIILEKADSTNVGKDYVYCKTTGNLYRNSNFDTFAPNSHHWFLFRQGVGLAAPKKKDELTNR